MRWRRSGSTLEVSDRERRRRRRERGGEEERRKKERKKERKNKLFCLHTVQLVLKRLRTEKRAFLIILHCINTFMIL